MQKVLKRREKLEASLAESVDAKEVCRGPAAMVIISGIFLFEVFADRGERHHEQRERRRCQFLCHLSNACYNGQK